MAIGSTVIFSDDFVRADDAGTLGDDYVVQCANGTPSTFGIISNQAALTSGGDSTNVTWAKIDPALIGSPDMRVRVAESEGTVGAPMGMWARLTTASDVPTGYVAFKVGSGAALFRYNDGVLTTLVEFSYVGAWDGTTGVFHLQLDVETDVSGNVVVTLSSASSDGGTYTSRATYTDSSADKILTAGTAAMAVSTNYSPANARQFDYFRVIGTPVESGDGTPVPVFVHHFNQLRN